MSILYECLYTEDDKVCINKIIIIILYKDSFQRINKIKCN